MFVARLASNTIKVDETQDMTTQSAGAAGHRPL